MLCSAAQTFAMTTQLIPGDRALRGKQSHEGWASVRIRLSCPAHQGSRWANERADTDGAWFATARKFPKAFSPRADSIIALLLSRNRLEQRAHGWGQPRTGCKYRYRRVEPDSARGHDCGQVKGYYTLLFAKLPSQQPISGRALALGCASPAVSPS